MKNKYRPFFYEKKRPSFINIVLTIIIGTVFLLYIGLQFPRIRQVIAQPLFAAASFVVNTGKDFFDATKRYKEPVRPRQTYTPLELPDQQVLFAESLESLANISQISDPLADLRQTPTVSEYSKVADWEYLDPNLNYDVRSSGSESDVPVRLDIIPPVFERADINNNGAAILSAALRYWGKIENQYQIAEIIHPHSFDPVVSFSDLSGYIDSRYPDLITITRMNGTKETLTAILKEDLPVLIQIQYPGTYTYWLRDDRWEAQYIIVHGYDSSTDTFSYQDSLKTNNASIGSAELLQRWYPFQRKYMIICPESQDTAIQNALSENYFEELNLQQAEVKFRTDSEMLPNDPFAQYNYGVILHDLGDEYGAWEFFQKSVEAALPQRFISYCPEILETALAIGYADDLADLTTPVLRKNPYDEEMTVYRGWAEIVRGNIPEGTSLIEKAEKLNPNNEKVRYAVKYKETMLQ